MKHDSGFERLVHRYVDGQLTASELTQLNERLRHDPQSRQCFNELLNLDSALGALVAGCVPNTGPPGGSPEERSETFEDCGRAPRKSPGPGYRRGAGYRHGPGSRLRTVPVVWLTAVVTTVVLGLCGTWWWQTSGRTFATVSSAAGVDGFVEGMVLRGESVRIEKGSLEFVTARGAQIAVEAPAGFRFESVQRLHLAYGRLAADVPPSAKGFTVVTPTGEAVDLGTKFGVDMPRRGDAEVHVFQGEVIARSSGGGNRRSLRDGEAFCLQSGAGAVRDLRSSAFIHPGEVASLRAALAAGQRARSEAALAQLRQDPAVIALLDFESEPLPEGAYRTTQGRWPGSQAPEFVNVGDHMKIDAGGDRSWPQLTLAAWVRLDRLGDPFQSLLHTDGWGQHDGQVHWMVTHHSTMRFALFHNTLVAGSKNRDRYYPDSLTPVLPQQGRWVHLAVVYDADQGTVRFYFNGKFDKEERQQTAHPARLGPAQIGNWDLNDRKLSGRMDELLILGRAMTDEQIRALFEAGTPYLPAE